MLALLRQFKRRLLTNGFAETVNLFLKDIEMGGDETYHPSSEYLINLSFDFEFGFGTTFWDGNIEKALEYGKMSRRNFIPIMKFLRERNIPVNVQVTTGLLYPNVSSLPIFDEEQKMVMNEHKELFKLTDEDVSILNSPNIEVGMHGFSHRHFDTLTPEEAEFEMRNAVDCFDKTFKRKPEFMAFPKNCVAHTDLIQKYGIKCWRANTEHPKGMTEVPLGHWFAPGVLGSQDLRRLLSAIKTKRQGYLLHLWGHFTEMDVETFKELVGVIKDSGWKLVTIKSFKKY